MKNRFAIKTIYFIKPAGLDGPVKIGCSDWPKERLLQLSVWSPWPLEVAATILGTVGDEQFLHCCFATSHSHREWFHSTPMLRETIAKIVAGATLADIREGLVPVGNIRSKARKPVPEYRKGLRSYTARIRCASKKVRAAGNASWYAPSDIYAIIKRWEGDPYRGVNGVAPTADERARLEEYLANPAAHSVIPSWDRPKVAA